MKRFLLVLLIVSIFLAGLLTLRFGSVLTQEENPLPILSAIMKLELSDSTYEQFSASDFEHRYVSANTRDAPYDVIKDFMDEKGWNFEEQEGSGLIFENEEVFIAIETRQYSKDYILWDVPGEVLN